MGGRRQCIAAARIPKFVRAQLNELRSIGVIDYARGVYRISDIALYSSCQLSALVAHHAGGSSGIPRESH
jgi:hypothetical protein